MNYFNTQAAAERYAKGRPYFHANTIERINNFIKPESKLNKALDIACGTGLSTEALLSISTDVYGTDASREMLKNARQADKINYCYAMAEQQPFTDNKFDLITVGSGVHWFDIDRFLKEANRLLKSKSWLVLYDNYFSAEMLHCKNFTDWVNTVYLKRFPSPPRNKNYDWSNENLNIKNFNFITEEKFKNQITFDKKQLVIYFTTQSNIISAVEKNQTTYEEVEIWLNKELTLFFDTDKTERIVYYGNWIKFIQKIK